jgi:hypothetical protein
LPAENGNKPENFATAVTEVSERVTVLVKEEIELARAEVMMKVSKLSKGLVAGAIGAALALLALPFVLLTIAWALNSALNSIWLGFLIVTVVMIAAMAGAFLFAWRKIKAAGSPAPTMAIDEAKKIREIVAAKPGNGNGSIAATQVTAPATPVSAPATPAIVPATPASVPATPADAPAEPTSVPAEPASVPAEPADVPATPADAPAEPETDS